jgi:steroid Delta-isomerase
MNDTALNALIAFYESLDAQSVGDMGRHYAENCYFKDPFNEVHRLADIQHIFRRMYRHMYDPCFRVTERIADAESVVLVWGFDFRMRVWRPGVIRRIHGVTLLRFDPEGKVDYHRDYWDAAEDLYEKLPGLGLLIRGLRCYVR